MANIEDQKNKTLGRAKISSNVKKLAGLVQNNMNQLFKNTFYSLPDSKRDLELISNNIHKSLDNIIANNVSNTGISNISSLYNRINSAQKDPEVVDKISSIFEDNKIMDNLMSSYIENKYLKDIDNEIEVVCKYMPKLEEALDTRRDNVLSSDHFTKDFLNIENSFNIKDEGLFNKRIAEIKEKYHLLEVTDDIYYRTDKYGEVYLYTVPYNKAISKLLKNKDKFATSNLAVVKLGEQTIVSESYDTVTMNKPNDEVLKEINSLKNTSINIEINTTNMLDDLILEHKKAIDKIQVIKETSVEYFSESENSKSNNQKKVPVEKSLFSDTDLDYEKIKDDDHMASDGISSPKIKNEDNDSRYKINIPGCIMKKLDRYNLIPVYVDTLCLGYYYMEFHDMDKYKLNTELADPVISLKSNTRLYNEPEMAKREELLKYISAELSKFIDAKFVNINQDLRKEIYMILKHNDMFNNVTPDNMKITFIPPEDVIHFHFHLDEKTHRGVSSLIKALLPAKLYSGLYITNTIATMTRGQDRRAYYVRQSIDTNIAKVLLNTIDQLKKTNFNIRQIENIQQVMNIIGRFNDFVIPVGPSGDKPIDFEVLQGQQINTQPELMDKLEEMAINSTDVPLELITARRSIDYVAQLNMTNSKFLRKVFKSQAKFQVFLSVLMTKLYNAEYMENAEITVKLPPPMFLNIVNTNQLMDNTNSMTDNIVNIYCPDQTDDSNGVVKAIFSRNLKLYYLRSYIDSDMVESILEKSKQEAKIEAPNAEQQ